MVKLTSEQKKIVEDNMDLVHYVLHKHFSSYFSNAEEYEEIAQVGFLALCSVASRYNDDIASFSSYACKFIWGKVLNYIQRYPRFAFSIRDNTKYKAIPYESLNFPIYCSDNGIDTELIDIVPDNNDVLDSVEFYDMLYYAFQEANPDYGLKILSFKLQGLKQSEISERIGICQSFVSKIISKAKNIYNSRN